MLRHYDQDERESDGSRHGESIKSVLVRKSLHMKEQEISVTKCGFRRSFEAAQRKQLSTAKIKMNFLVIYELFKGILVVFQSKQN